MVTYATLDELILKAKKLKDKNLVKLIQQINLQQQILKVNLVS